MAQKNFIERISSETPVFFKRITKAALTLSATATAIIASPSVVKGFVLPASLETLCQYAIVAGLAAAAVSKTTVVDVKKEEQPKDPQ